METEEEGTMFEKKRVELCRCSLFWDMHFVLRKTKIFRNPTHYNLVKDLEIHGSIGL